MEKVIKKPVKIKAKRGRPWPAWAKNLPSGKYTTDELVIWTGGAVSLRAINKFMQAHCKEIIPYRKSNNRKGTIFLNCYVWEQEKND